MSESALIVQNCNRLFRASRSIEGIRHPYVANALRRGLDNYRILDMEAASMVGLGGLPSFVLKFISQEKEVLGIFYKHQKDYVYVVLRSLKEKNFRFYGLRPVIPYGLSSLSIEYGDPVLVVEGPYDRDSITSLFPNTIALLNSKVRQFSFDILSRLTNFFILCFDRDPSGRSGEKRFRSQFPSNKYRVRKLELPLNMKDLGDIVNAYNDGAYANAAAYERSVQFELENIVRGRY